MQATTQKSVTIRPLYSREWPFLREMIYEALYIPAGEEPPPFEIVDQPAIRKYIADWGRAGDAAMVAVQGGKLVGAAWCRLFTEENPGYGFIDSQTPEISIALRTGYRGQGLGTRLLADLLEQIRRAGFEKVSLSVDVRNPAHRLYRRLGFAEVETMGHICLMQYQL